MPLRSRSAQVEVDQPAPLGAALRAWATVSTPDVFAVPHALRETMPIAVAYFGSDRILQYASARARTVFGLREDASGSETFPTLDALLSSLNLSAEALITAVGSGVTPAPLVVRTDTARGSRVIELALGPTADGGVFAMASDITDRESMLNKLDRRARELGAIFDLTPLSVRVFDADGHIVRANGNAVHEDEGVPRRSLADLFVRDAPLDADGRRPIAETQHPVSRALSGETVRAQAYVVQRGPESRRRLVETYAAPIVDAQHRIQGAVLVERDMTEQHRLAAELSEQVRRTSDLNARVSTEAERLDRMVDERSRQLLVLQESRARDRRLAAVGQLAAGVMHDVNNALNPILAAAWLLDHHAENPAMVRDYAARITKAAETGATTAARVGRFLRQEPIHANSRAVVDLSLIANEVLQLSEPLIESRRTDAHRVTIVRDFADGNTIQGIIGELREALLNLVQNAVDAMPNGGTLTIRTVRSESEACVLISDTGCGMSDDVRDRAFEPFFTTKGAGGSGLGLSEVYGIVRRHRGRVDISSEPARGTTIRLGFPFEAHGVEEVRPPLNPSGASLSVLLVEDHADGREFLRQVLTEVGHRVEAVATYADARAKLDVDVSPFDLLLTDIGLPDGSGWELVALTRERHPVMRIGVVTGWEPTVRRTGAVAADFILRKPLRTQEVLARLARPLASPHPKSSHG